MNGIIIKKEIRTQGAKKQEVKEEGKKDEAELKTPSPLLKWEAPEYEYIPKKNSWFWSVGILALGLAFASILLGNVLFAILVVISGMAIVLYGARRPRKVLFSFSPRGLQIENRLFPYENLKSFWIHYEPPYKKLLAIEPKKFFMSIINVPLADIDPNLIRQHLLRFLKEERHEESFIQTLMRLVGF